MGLSHFEDGICKGCGSPTWLSRDPLAEGQFTAPLPVRCHGCTAILQQQKNYDDASHRQALSFYALPKEGLVERVTGHDGHGPQ